MEITEKHKAGFVSLLGNPNVGKSTLMNTLVGEKLSIISAKAQTTKTAAKISERIFFIFGSPFNLFLCFTQPSLFALPY